MGKCGAVIGRNASFLYVPSMSFQAMGCFQPITAPYLPWYIKPRNFAKRQCKLVKSSPGRSFVLRDRNHALKKRLMVGHAPMSMGISPQFETRCHNFSLFENLVFGNIDGRKARNYGSAFQILKKCPYLDTCWRSPDHKALLKCRCFGHLDNVPGRTTVVDPSHKRFTWGLVGLRAQGFKPLGSR